MRNQVAKISKRTWYDLGGFSRVGLFRKADTRGRWSYYIDHGIFSTEG